MNLNDKFTEEAANQPTAQEKYESLVLNVANAPSAEIFAIELEILFGTLQKNRDDLFALNGVKGFDQLQPLLIYPNKLAARCYFPDIGKYIFPSPCGHHMETSPSAEDCKNAWSTLQRSTLHGALSATFAPTKRALG